MKKQDALEKWGNYQGSQMKPADFDTFWQEAKEEVEALGLRYELKAIDFPSNVVEAFELSFMGVGQAKIVCQLVQPKNIAKKLPVILQFHGYHVDAGDWSEKVSLAAEGMIVVAMDVRGQGGLSQDTLQTTGGTLKGHLIRGLEEGPKKLFYRAVFQDVYQLSRIVGAMPEVDNQQMISYGVSQGGALAFVCAALCPTISKTFVQYPFLSDYREAYRLEVTSSAYEELAYWFRYRDPLHKKEEQVFATLDYIDVQYFASFIQADVVWAMALEDHTCHPKTQFAVFNQLKSQKQLLYYPEYGHEYLPQFSDEMRKVLLKEGVI
ncbi:acetylxylan esterase [Streptococcus sp. KHUD_010]|uniref:Acetylxylan esterase n=2 Tax=Streptococcus TaxID=1301 RepID=A0AAU7Q036_9STRE|nr:acetylxylan esterase [Streptococcus hominis]MBC5617945.1 acetylxylan esterase [Streptococcus hominis]